MALRESLARLFGAKASLVPLSLDSLPDRPLEKGHDDATLLSTYGDDAWPYIVANKVGQQASQAPIQVGRMTQPDRKKPPEFEPLPPEHPVQSLFDDPNPQMDGGEWVHQLVVVMGLTGHQPIEVVRGARDRIGAPGRAGQRDRSGFELWLPSPGPWRIVPNRDGTIRGYLYELNGAPDIAWTTEQMTYLRWPNPRSRWYGQGHIQAVRQQVMAEEYAAIRDRKFEKNLGVPPGILSFETPIGETQAEEIRKRWEKSVGGAQNAGRVAVMGSKGQYLPVSLNARDSEWLAQRMNRVEIICAAWGVPLPLIRMEDATFSNAEAARAEFWEGTLQPQLNRIARMLTKKLIPLITTEPLVVRFDYSKIEALGENDLEAAQTAAEWTKTGSVTVNEVRQRLGLDPHPDTAFGERLLVPTTLQLQDPKEVAEAAKLGLEGQRVTNETTANPPPVPRSDEPAPSRRRSKAEDPDRDALLAPIRAQYERDLASYFLAQRGALNPMFKALPSDEAETIIERALAVLTAKRFRDRLRRISQGPIETAVTLGAEGAARTLGISTSFAIPASEAALERVTAHLERLGKGIENTTVTDVRRVLETSLRDGVDNAETRRRLDELFDGYQDWRLDRISRTETVAAYNLGSIGQYRDAGVQAVKVADGDTDAPCAAANGATWTLEQADADPLAHPNCTRTFIPDTTGL